MCGLNFARVIYNTRCTRLNPGTKPMCNHAGLRLRTSNTNRIQQYPEIITISHFVPDLAFHNEFSREKN